MHIKRFRFLDFEIHVDRRQILKERIRKYILLAIVSLIVGLVLWNVMLHFVTRDYIGMDDYDFVLKVLSNAIIIIGIIVRTISKIKTAIDFEKQLALWIDAAEPEL